MSGFHFLQSSHFSTILLGTEWHVSGSEMEEREPVRQLTVKLSMPVMMQGVEVNQNNCVKSMSEFDGWNSGTAVALGCGAHCAHPVNADNSCSSNTGTGSLS